MFWDGFLADLVMFSGRFGDVFWMFRGCLLDVLGMFSGGISQTKQHRVTHPCRVAVVSLLTREQKINQSEGVPSGVFWSLGAMG